MIDRRWKEVGLCSRGLAKYLNPRKHSSRAPARSIAHVQLCRRHAVNSKQGRWIARRSIRTGPYKPTGAMDALGSVSEGGLFSTLGRVGLRGVDVGATHLVRLPLTSTSNCTL